jgi:TRAP-type C4-dicarboxylate transport system permease small subunit
VTARLPPKAQAALNVVNYAIIAVFLVAMIGYGSWLAYITRARPFQGIPGFSYSWVTISVPIGCALMLVTVLHKMREFVDAWRTGQPVRRTVDVTEAL